MPSKISVEEGVYTTFGELKIKEPTTAVEMLAIRLAQAIDAARYAKDLPPLAAQLRQTLEDVANQTKPEKSGIEQMTEKY